MTYASIIYSLKLSPERLHKMIDNPFRRGAIRDFWQRKLETMREELDEYERDRLLPEFYD